jgi:multidrug resistance efflux pump
MKLSKRPRFDTLQNEIRRRGNSWDRLIYLGLVGAFLVWMFDLFIGDHVYLRADGLVLRDRVVLATQFTAQVEALEVVEGGEVKQGQIVAQLRSKEAEETLAKLSSEIAIVAARRTQFRVRQKVISAVRTTAEHSFQTARVNRVKTEELIDANLISNKRVSELIESEFKTKLLLAEMEAEAIGIELDLPQLDAAISEAMQAREQLKKNYNDGRIDARVDGIVGSLPISKGSVARMGEPLMDIFTGDPYVLAYVPEGALYELQPGDPVHINIGLKTYLGEINRMFPVTSQLPKEFQDTVRPPPRARVIRISFAGGQQPPTLFAKPRIKAASWWPEWIGRYLFSPASHSRPAGQG